MKNLLFGVLVLFSVACAGPEKRDYSVLPEGILSFEEVTDLMTDLQFEIALHQKRYVQRNNLVEIVDHRYDSVFVAHGTTAEDLEETLFFYSEDPEYLLTIYEQVLENLSKRMGELKARKSRGEEYE